MKDLQARIATFLRGKPGGLYCDDCIREEFPDATIEDVGRETESMHGQIGFLKIPDICTRCGQQKPVTFGAGVTAAQRGVQKRASWGFLAGDPRTGQVMMSMPIAMGVRSMW